MLNGREHLEDLDIERD